MFLHLWYKALDFHLYARADDATLTERAKESSV